MAYPVEPLDTKKFRQMYIVVSTLPAVLLILTFVLWFMGADGWDSQPVDVSRVHLPLFAAIALASLPLALWLRGMTLRRTGAFTGQASGLAPAQTVTGEAAAIARITQAVIVGMAIPEQSILLGFVLGFLSQKWAYYVPFAAYTVLGWAIMFPRPAQVRAWYASQTAESALPPMNT